MVRNLKQVMTYTDMKHAPATLLAEPLFLASDCDLCSFGMNFADLMAPVIVPAVTEIRVAAIDKTRHCLCGVAKGTSSLR